MAEIINMPRLSDTMEEGTVAKWFKKVGDKINEGDILAEIETDKATMEFESFNEGELLHIGIQEGGTAPVDTLLAIIGKKDEDISSLIKSDGNTISNDKEGSVAIVSSEEVSPTENTSMPEGAELITMPRLSDTMEEGTVATWNKKVGDIVNEGDILAEIETDKATMEFESFHQGTLLYIGLQEGESAPVDSVLAIIGKKGTDVDTVLAVHGRSHKSEMNIIERVDEKTPISPSLDKDIEVSVALNPKVSSGNGRVIASPLAKKLAAEKGVNLNQIQGSGDHGRIIKRDIDSFQTYQADHGKPFAPTGVESVTVIANSQMRKTIAKRLTASKFSAPHYYLGVEFDMDNAISFREQYNSLPETKISFNDIVVKASALA